MMSTRRKAAALIPLTPEMKLSVITYRNRPVMTLAMIDLVHQRPEGTAGRNFRENRDRFIQGEDFFVQNLDEFRRAFPSAAPVRGSGEIMLLTESGYLMLVKSFTDDLAWKVQRELVKSYFRAQPTNNIHFLVPKTLPEALRLAADLAEFGEVAA